MNKKFWFVVLLAALNISVFAQEQSEEEEEDEPTGFKKENIFLGGGLNIVGGTGRFGIGIMPEIGYSVADWLDAGLVFNYNYYSERADPYWNNNVRIRNSIFGAGMFVRIYPIKSIFINLQPEINWLTSKQRYEVNGIEQTYKANATSVLGGIGYATRTVGENNFYIMIAVDLMQEAMSPYRDQFNRAIIQYRSGFNFYLRPSRKKSR